MSCPQCGNQATGDAARCGKCGHELERPPRPEASAPAAGADIPQPAGWLDRQFANSSVILMFGLPLLFPIMIPLMLLLSGLTLASKHPVARRRARIVFGVLVGFLSLIGFIVIESIITTEPTRPH